MTELRANNFKTIWEKHRPVASYGAGWARAPHEWSVPPPHEPAAPVPHKKALEALAVLWAAGGSGPHIISCLDSVLYAERLYD